MIKRYMLLLGFLLSVVFCSTATLANELIALCYHDVRDAADAKNPADMLVVGGKQLAEQFEWLRQNGYVPVSVDQLELARKGNKALPSKAVLLTFDDGYESFYTRVFPLLKQYNYPAVMALVGRWLNVSETGVEQEGRGKTKGGLSAIQIREMQKSGLIEFASHTYDLHKRISANYQGEEKPAVITRLYIADQQRYETQQQHSQRISRDFLHSREQLHQLTGVAPRVMVWPFGVWNISAENVARSAGFSWFLLLGDDSIRNDMPSSGRIERHMLVSNPTLDEFSKILKSH